MTVELFWLLLAIVAFGGVLYVLLWAGSTIAKTQIDMDSDGYDGQGRCFGWPRHWLHPDDQCAEHTRVLWITANWRNRASRLCGPSPERIRFVDQILTLGRKANEVAVVPGLLDEGEVAEMSAGAPKNMASLNRQRDRAERFERWIRWWRRLWPR